MPDLKDRIEKDLQGRYRVEREIGRGGMAVVYLAQDVRHERPVAIKVLRPDLSHLLGAERFLREIRLTARLRHPNLLPVYDSGEADGSLFYVVPYIEGGSLRDELQHQGRLPLKSSLRIVREAAEALDCAHRHDVVHRDIKPENILLEDGHAVVADFGIARAVSAAAEVRAPTTLTQTGLLIGTPAYMSPEQANGGPIDGRSDIYSLGCVLFELIMGRPLFTGSSPLEILAKRFTASIPSLRASDPAVPAGVEEIVLRALAERCEDRFQTARELAEAIAVAEAKVTRADIAPTSILEPPRVTALAVLPFVNMSSDPENEYFSDGITEGLINAFTNLPGLRVASRTSAFACKGKNLDIPEIARKLNVTTVLEGSVRRAASRVRLTAQLVDATSGYELWSETYDRQLADIFDLEDELSRAIVSTLRPKLLTSEQIRRLKPATANVEAYQLYLKGRFFWHKRAPDAMRKGVEYFEQAIQIDPEYALAYSGLADSYHMLAVYGVLLPREAYPKAKAAAKRALDLDDGLAEAHVSAAYIALCFDWDARRAELELHRAIELNPSYAQAYHWLAWTLDILERFDEAATAARRAIELEPLSPVILARGGHTLTYAGWPKEGAAASARALELDPGFFVALETLASAQYAEGRFSDAIAVLQCALEFPASTARFILPYVHAAIGNREHALELLADLRLDLSRGRVPPGYTFMHIAGAYGELGDRDEAFRWLDWAYGQRSWALLLAKLDRVFEPIRSDPRYTELLRRTGLEERS